MGEKRLFNVKEASEYLSIAVWTIYQWVSMKKIPYVKLGRALRFDKKMLDSWVERNLVRHGDN